MKEIALLEKKYLKEKVSSFRVGDRVKVSLKVKEGDKTRTQIFEGVVIRKRGEGMRANFTVLKSTRGSTYTVEKTFPIHSPVVENVTVVASKKERRSKLYHLRSNI
ncbi:MAG: 50S ribosomal protein L19 [Candidatus Omnitrophica bacterium]|nr:50S ribosomal protein L19 [Candidatus Omnitrophota bacterium]